MPHTPPALSTERRPPTHVLIIRPSALGDVCRSVGVLSLLRASWPDAQIDWLVQDSFADAVRHHPALSGGGGGGVVEFPRAALADWWKSPYAARGSIAFLRMLRAQRYDVVLDCQGLLRSGIFAWATGAPIRYGYADAAEGGAWFVNHRVDAPRSLHTVDRMMRLADAAVGGGGETTPSPSPDLRLYTGESDRAWLGSQRTEKHLGPRYAVLAPTSRWEGKRWPAERFAQVAQHLLSTPRLNIDSIVVVAGPGDREAEQARPLTDLARTNPRVVSFVGATSVGKLMTLIEGSSLVVANDSAALHMAVGFARPYVALFGPTDVALVGPYTRGNANAGVVLQHVQPGERLDHKDDALGAHYIQRITVDEVIDALDKVAKWQSGRVAE